MKTYIKILIATLFSLVNVFSIEAQTFTETYHVEKCKDSLFMAKLLVGDGVKVYSNGEPSYLISQTQDDQVGIYSNLKADAIPGFTNGVILSTGYITDGSSKENLCVTNMFVQEGMHKPDDPPSSKYDADADNYFGGLEDPAGIVLYIQPQNRTINIPFVMASEHFYFWPYVGKSHEYPDLDEYASYSDKFAFFLKEVGDAESGINDDGLYMTNNIAQLPEGGDVEIATVNQHTNTAYFVSNVITNENGEFAQFPHEKIALPMEFNGAIVGPVAVATNLNTKKIYKLKIIIGDDPTDNTVNSVVFLKEHGITSGADLKIDLGGPVSLDKKGPVTFTNTLSNVGPAFADGVVVTNYLPAGVTEVTYDDPRAGRVALTTIGESKCLVWEVGDRFSPNSNAVLRVNCTLESGTYDNLAHVVTETGDYNESNNTSELVTVVGNVKPALTIKTAKITKCYGEAVNLSAFDFIESVTDTLTHTNVMKDVIAGIEVTFTNRMTHAAADPEPTKADAVVGTNDVFLSNALLHNPDNFGEITYVSGELVVTQALLTISVTNVQWRVGTKRPVNGIEDFSSLLKAGDTPAQITGDGGLVYTNAVWSALRQPPEPTDDDVEICSTYPKEIWLTRDCLDGERAANYAITIKPGDLTLLKQLPILTVTAIETNKFENKEMVLPALDFILEIKGTNGTQTVTGIDVTFTNVQDNAEAWPTNANAAAGEYKIYLSNIQGTGLDYENFREIKYNPGKLTVKESAPLYVRAISTNKVYGSELTLSALQCVASAKDKTGGLHVVTDIEVSFTNSAGVAADPRTTAAVVDTYGIVLTNAQVAALSDFSEVIYEPGVFYVTPKPIKIVPRNDLTKTYGDKNYRFLDSDYAITDVDGNAISVPDVREVTLQSAGALPTAQCLDGGFEGYDVTVGSVEVEGAGNYEIIRETGKLYVTQFPITITANDVTNVYGEATTFQGFKVDPVELPNNEWINTVTLTNEKPITTGVGTYPGKIVPSHEVTVAGGNESTNNYEFAFVPGELTVIERNITIHAKDQWKTYGDDPTTYGGDPEKDFEVLDGSLPAWDTITSVHIDCDEALSVATPADTYVDALVPGHDVTGSINTNNYNIAFKEGTLTVEQRPITVTPVNTNKVYGSTLVFTGNRNEFEFDDTVLKNGDSITNVVLTSDGTNRIAKVRADNYDILAKNADGKGVENYVITYGTGTLEVVKFPIGITVINTNKVYGEVLEFKGTENEFTVTPAPDALPNDERVTHVTFVCSDSTNRLSAAGPHDINIDQLSVKGYSTTGLTIFDTNNYAIAFTNGILTVDKAPLIITANDATNCYGETSSFVGTEFSVQPWQLKNDEQVTSVHLTNLIPATTNVGTYAHAIRPSHAVTVTGGNASSDNYEIAFVDGTLTITQACLTVTVEDSVWKVGKEHPEYAFKSFATQLKAGDQEVDVTGGTVTFTNARWQVVWPTKEYISEVPYSNEVWIVLESFNGPRATNYWITVIPGAVTVIHAEPRLETTVSSTVNRTTGLRDLELTIVNVGDGEVLPGYDYWVQLKPGPAETGRVNGVELFYEHTYYLANPTGTMSNGYDYVDLTPFVTNALANKYDGDVVFETNRFVTVTNALAIYHWKRWDPNDYITNISSNFLVAGRLYSPADADHNFVVTEEEKKSEAAKALLGLKDVTEYIEMTRLALLPYYYWDVQEEKWVCPEN